MNDETETIIEGLHPSIQPHATTLVVAAREAGIPLVIISGRRSPERNAAVGGAPSSMHLVGLAFDVGLVQVDAAGRIVRHIPRQLVPASWWQALGMWGEQVLGLTWGGRFVHNGARDVNHFDLRNIA